MSHVTCTTAGLTLRLESTVPRWVTLAREACAGQEVVAERADLHVSVEARQEAFSLRGFDPLTRDAWSDGRNVVLEDACASGLDLHLAPQPDGLHVRARSRPGWSHRGLGLLAPARTLLLWRCALLQYPALWWAGVSGAVPLHVSALRLHGEGLVLAGPGGVGKSTLVRSLAGHGAEPVSDNLCVGRAGVVHGLLEPMRVEGGTGRRMPHGRREAVWSARQESVPVRRVVVLRRGTEAEASCSAIDSAEAARVVAGGTYAAGELRRYWAFAATLALGTGLGPAHPSVEAAARAVADEAECVELRLPARAGTDAAGLLLAGADPAGRPATTGTGAA